MRNCQILLLMHEKLLQKNIFAEMSGPQLWLCLCTFRPIASKQLNSLTTIHTLSWLDAVVTHPLWVQEVPGSIPGFGKVFMFDCLFCCCCVFTFCPKTHNLSLKFAITFTTIIYLVYLLYSKICDRLQGYKDTDLASLNDDLFCLNRYCCYLVRSLHHIVLLITVVC